jgi:hypothetical protein
MMAALLIEIPESLLAELNERHVSNETVRQLVIAVIEAWLQNGSSSSGASPFADSAAPFIEQLLDDNQELFERLAKL